MTKWTTYFGFDVMGDLAFGKSFNMLGTEGDHFILDLFAGRGPALGFMQCAPWLFILFQRLPIINRQLIWWVSWCAEPVRERRKMDMSRKDLFSYLLGDLVRDSELAIIAGSDTTSSTLSALMYLLTNNPDKLKLLQRELDDLFQPDEPISPLTLQKEAPFPQGCINEALRLYPAVPGGLQRVTPPNGAQIAGRWIPGNTVVSTPTYVLHRGPRYFQHPESFIPERWSVQPHLIHNKSAFCPFLIGPYSCVGKSHAYMEMRILVYYLVKTFDFEFPPATEPGILDLFESPSGFKDHFVGRAPGYDLIFAPRS